MEKNIKQDQPQFKGEKPTWQPPQMVCLGRLSDLVQGGPGKTSGSFDNDAGGNRLPRGQSR